MKRIFGLTAFCVMVLLAGAARVGRADSVVAPFVDSQTNLVVHVDFTSLDVDQLDAWVQKSISQISDPDKRAKAQEQSQKSIDSMKTWIGKFKTAGGKDLYLALSLSGMIQGTPGGLIIPLNGADPAALAKVINPRGNPPPADPNDPNAAQARMMPQTAVVGNALVLSTGGGLDKLKTPSTEPRQDFIDGLAAGGDSTLHVVLSPSTLKNNPLFGAMVMSKLGGQGGAQQQPPFSDPHWDSVTWMSISVVAPPKEAGNCVLQCKDSDSASAMADYINQQLQDAKNDPSKRGALDPDDFAKLLAAVKPAVNGTQVVISLDQDTLDNVIGPIMTKQMNKAPAPGEGGQGPQPGAGGAPPPPPPDGNGM